MQKIKILFICAPLILLTSCIPTQKKQKKILSIHATKQNLAKKNIDAVQSQIVIHHIPRIFHTYKIAVAEIECSLCAQSVIEQLKLIQGVESVEFKLTGTNYQQGYLELIWQQNNEPSKQSIHQALNNLGYAQATINHLQRTG